MKKIDVVLKFFYPVTAGIEINCLNVYGFMKPHGWDITVHTSKDTPDAKNSLAQSDEIRGLTIKRYNWNWYGFYPSIDWKNSYAICLHNFNVFPHSWLLMVALIRRALGFHTPKIFLIPHGGFTPGWTTFTPIVRITKQLYQKFLGKHLINLTVNGLRSVSEWESQETIKHGVKKALIKTIPNGLEREVYEDIEQKASKQIRTQVKELGDYLVQIGRIHPIKNQLTTIKALQYLPESIKFAIAGPITDRNYKILLDQEIKRLNLEKRVIFMGVVSGIDKYFLLRKSLANTHMAVWESYCNAVHESMSQGCICVVSKNTALEELITDGKNGFCVDMFDAKAVANKILYLLNSQNQKTILKMKKTNIDFTKGHSWQEISAKVEQMYLTMGPDSY